MHLKNLLNNLLPNKTAVIKNAYTQDAVDAIKILIADSVYKPGVRETAESILAEIPQKNWREEMRAIYNYVRDNIRYTQDIDGVETIKTPQLMIAEIRNRGMSYGDCDDHTVLLGALLKNAGYSVRLAIMRSLWNKAGGYNHIYLQAGVPMTNQWVALDATAKQKPFGWQPEFLEQRLYPV